MNQPLQVRDTVLAPGQYVFKLVKLNGSQSVAGIHNADGTRPQG